MEPLTIHLLGTPDVLIGGQPLVFPTRKVLALLIYLVVDGGRPSRETLTALLWPESLAEKAGVTLRGTLSRLRKALWSAGEAILTDGSTVAFNRDIPCELDLDRLAAAARSDIPPADLQAVLSLDRGDFLQGFTLPDAPAFDTWAAVQREACERQVEALYDRLSQQQLAAHAGGAAVESAARWVARSPLSEQAHRRLMAAQALHGRRSAALQTYRQLQQLLQEELGVEPSRETVALAETITQGRFGPEPGRPPAPRGALTSGTGGHGETLRLTLPLVGRAEEHSRLVAAYRQSGQGVTQVTAVIGAAGAGKSRLTAAFREWVRLAEPQAEIWQGRAFETGGRLAYQPVVEALRPRLEQVNAPEDLLDDVWLAELSQLIPELRARYPDLPPPLTGDPGFVRSRLFEALALLGSALAEGRSALFVLDDMQWADADSLDLVHYLARRWSEAGAPILLLLVIRQEAYAADTALRDRLGSLSRDTVLTRMLLDNLGGKAVTELVAALSGAGAQPQTTADFAAWLWAETRGLPFFMEALLQMLVAQGVLPVLDPGKPALDFAAALSHVRSVSRVPLPPGVREVIQARLAQQSQAGSALLAAAAVMGRACTFVRLQQVADLREPEALEALEELLDGGLLTERPADLRPYLPGHDYIREVVYTDLREARRRVYHRRALLTLEQSGAPAAECAFHALASLLDEPAFRYGVAAGRDAIAAYAAQEALAHFANAREVALRMRAGGAAVDGALLTELYRLRGQALELIRDDEGAQANYEEMRAEALSRGDPAMELAALISRSFLHGTYTGVFNPAAARELATQARAKARELGDRAAEAGALWVLTAAEFFSGGDTAAILATGEEGLALARELGLKELVAGTLNILCWAYVGQYRLDLAREALSEAQAVCRELGDLPRLGEAYRFMLIVHFVAGDLRRLLAEAPELEALSITSGIRLDQLSALAWLADAHGQQGRFAQALGYLDEVGALCAAIGYRNEEHAHMIGRIKLYLAAGAPEEAEEWADRLLAEREMIMPTLSRYYLSEAARAKVACGKLDEGAAILDELLRSLPPGVPEANMITMLMVTYGTLNLARGRPDALFAGLDERARPFRAGGFHLLLAEEQRLRGLAALALGDYEAAREVLLQARATAEAQEERTVLWRILVGLADVAAASGDAAGAAGYRAEALEVISYIEAHAGALREAFLAQPGVAAFASN